MASEVVQDHVELVAESGVVSVIVACQRVVELREICCSKWSKVVALVVACQRAWIRRLKLGWDA